MSWTQPGWLLLAVPLLLVWRLAWRRRAATACRSTAVVPVMHTFRTRLYAWLQFLVPAGFVLGALALADPGSARVTVRNERQAAALMLALDVSGSMAAPGAAGWGESTKLEAAQRALAGLAGRRADDLLGVVLFAGYTETRCPLTDDRDAVRRALADARPAGGRTHDEHLTALGDGLAAALARLREAPAGSRAVVLVSDGVANTGEFHPALALRAALAQGTKVFCIGIGDRGGAEDAVAGEALLRRLAEASGGRYFRADDPSDLERVVAAVDGLSRAPWRVVTHTRRRSWAPPLLAAALWLITGGCAGCLLLRRALT